MSTAGRIESTEIGAVSARTDGRDQLQHQVETTSVQKKKNKSITSEQRTACLSYFNEVLEEMMAPEVGGKRTWYNMAASEHAYYNPMLRKMMADPFKSIILGILKNYV